MKPLRYVDTLPKPIAERERRLDRLAWVVVVLLVLGLTLYAAFFAVVFDPFGG